MESEAKVRPFSLEKLTTNSVIVVGKTLDPYLKWAQEQMHPKILHFLSWKHCESTGCIFAVLYSVLLTLHYFYFLYLVSFTLFALLMISVTFKFFHIIYIKCVPTSMSDESRVWQHPLKPYIEKHLKISEKGVHRVVDESIRFIDKFVQISKEILFVNNLVESSIVWCIFLASVYCGVYITALNLIRRTVVILFIISLPFGYIEHKTTVDQICRHAAMRIHHGKKYDYKHHGNSSTEVEHHKASLDKTPKASLNESSETSLGEKHEASLSEIVIMKVSSIMFLLHLELKMFYYLLTPIVISSLTYLLMCLFEIEIPHIESVTGKRSIFNQMFVKFGWGWTLGLLLPFQLTLVVIYHNRWQYLRNIVIKTSITTAVFYVWCQVIFPAIEELNGECKHGGSVIAINKRECIKSPEHTYSSAFDISGHAFLMSYCVLIMMYEAQKVEDLLKALKEPGKHENLVSNASKFAAPFVAISFLLITILSLLWDCMIIITNIYFHTFPEIFVGILLAVLMVLIIYEKLLPCLLYLL